MALCRVIEPCADINIVDVNNSSVQVAGGYSTMRPWRGSVATCCIFGCDLGGASANGLVGKVRQLAFCKLLRRPCHLVPLPGRGCTHDNRFAMGPMAVVVDLVHSILMSSQERIVRQGPSEIEGLRHTMELCENQLGGPEYPWTLRNY